MKKINNIKLNVLFKKFMVKKKREKYERIGEVLWFFKMVQYFYSCFHRCFLYYDTCNIWTALSM